MKNTTKVIVLGREHFIGHEDINKANTINPGSTVKESDNNVNFSEEVFSSTEIPVANNDVASKAKEIFHQWNPSDTYDSDMIDMINIENIKTEPIDEDEMTFTEEPTDIGIDSEILNTIKNIKSEPLDEPVIPIDPLMMYSIHSGLDDVFTDEL